MIAQLKADLALFLLLLCSSFLLHVLVGALHEVFRHVEQLADEAILTVTRWFGGRENQSTELHVDRQTTYFFLCKNN